MPGGAKYIQVLVDRKLVDVELDQSMSLDYGINDTLDVNSVSGSSSKQINLAGTKNTLKIFGHLEELETTDVDQLSTKDGMILCDGVDVLRGKCKPLKVIRNRDNYSIQSVFYGDNANWFDHLKTTKLNQLAFDMINLGGTAIVDSWYELYRHGWQYAAFPVNYGKWKDAAAKGVSKYDIRPHLYVRTIVDKIFASAGYQLDSTFMDTDFFKKLCMLFSGEVNKKGYMQDTYGAQQLQIALSFNASYNNDTVFTAESTNLGGSRGVSAYQIHTAGVYRITAAMISTTVVPANAITDVFYGYKVFLHNNGTGVNTQLFIDSLVPTDLTNSGGEAPLDFEVTLEEDAVGQTLHIQLINSVTNTSFPVSVEIGFEGKTAIYLSDEYVPGQDMFPANWLPSDPCSDFINGITAMFNLKWHTSEANKRIVVEPRDKTYAPYCTYTPFYQRGIFEDWTKKADHTKEINIQPYLEGRKSTLLSYKESNDTNVSRVNKGQDLLLFAARFGDQTAQENAFENPYFSLCYHLFDQQINFLAPGDLQAWPFNGTRPGPSFEWPFTNHDAIYIPSIWSGDVADNGDYPAQSFNIAPTIVYFEGMKAMPTQFAPSSKSLKYEGAQTLHRISGLKVYPLSYMVNYEGSINDPNLSYCDITLINAGISRGLAFNFFLQYLATIKEGKQVDGFFYLYPKDIGMLDFRKIIKIDGDNLILANIKGYSPANDTSTECVLIKDHPFTLDDIALLHNSPLKGYKNG